ncbi:hypothetical protein [Methylopila sp. M107]|uniref:hypothetical protein n=1 Tax=Methylopila sp. M107 TaxID=1101190 RepID=UPI000364C350|nr:hypothetical protein [Methylopila sp. M107]
MAYISHSPFDYRSLRERASHVSPSLLIRSALIAVAAAVAMLALSEANMQTAPTAPLAQKGDRLGAAAGALPGDTGAVTTNIAARTTTVERGAVAGLSPDSPMSVVVK